MTINFAVPLKLPEKQEVNICYKTAYTALSNQYISIKDLKNKSFFERKSVETDLHLA